MSGYLLDTHIWLWYLAGDERLPGSLKDELDRSREECWLSPISVWELGHLVQRQRFTIRGEVRDWFAAASRELPLRDAPISHEIALVSHLVDLPHRDPADRLLAATTIVYELTLVTVDRRLADARWLPTRSA